MKKTVTLKGFMVLVLLAWAGSASAQGLKDIRINEIQVYNTHGPQDIFGAHVSWIELYNTGHSAVNVGGAYLKVRYNQYRIPSNDVRTIIPPQGYLIFYAEGTAAKGTFHTNFTLEESDYIALLNQSGKGTPVDSLYYDRSQMIEDVSYGWIEDEDGVESLQNLPILTPGATNNTIEKLPRSEKFRREDPHGAIMAILAISIVFCSLLCLFFIFKYIGKLFVWLSKRRTKKEIAENPEDIVKVMPEDNAELTGEELAAIAMAIYQYSKDLHDVEKTVLTINRAAKTYSPWSSKIYGLRQLPNKK